MTEEKLAEECFMPLTEYREMVTAPIILLSAQEQGLSPHQLVKRIADSKKEYFEKERAAKRLAREELERKGLNHFFVLFDKEHEIITVVDEISAHNRDSMIADYHRYHLTPEYIKGAVDYASDLDLGTKVFRAPE